MSAEAWRRYALYYAPPRGSALAAFGAAWMGRDAETGAAAPRFVLDGAPAPLEALTVNAARYGFHATLKPPFTPKSGVALADLEAALAAFAEKTPPARGPALAPRHDLGFVALRPSGPSPEIDALAFDVVQAFEPFRAPPSAAELEKRRALGLSAGQEAMLAAYGYPFLGSEFRFHITLTHRLDASTAADLARRLEAPMAAIAEDPFVLGEVALFGDPGEGRPFSLLTRRALAG